MGIGSLSTLVPLTLREEAYDPLSPWSISEALLERLNGPAADASNSMFRKIVVLPTDPEWRLVISSFSQDLPNRYAIKAIHCVHNANLMRAFESHLIIQDLEARKFSSNWQQEPHPELRTKVIERWRVAADLFSPLVIAEGDGRRREWNNVKVLPVWHGTNREVSTSVCESGFLYFGKTSIGERQADDAKSTDVGFFGSGIYFTNSARYAADIYAQGQLLFAWVSMREPFPVVDGDMQVLKGKGAYKHYNAHIVPVQSANERNPYEPNYYPCKEGMEPHCDELVVFQTAQTLPRFVVDLEPLDLYLKKIAANPQQVEDLIPILRSVLQSPQVEKNERARTGISSFLAGLMQMNPLAKLTDEQLQTYPVFLQMAESAGRVGRVSREILSVADAEIDIEAAPPALSDAASFRRTSEARPGSPFETRRRSVYRGEEDQKEDYRRDLRREGGPSLQEMVVEAYRQGCTFRDKKNYADAVIQLNFAAEGGYAPAQHLLGLMYLQGKGVPKNLARATELLELVFLQNYGEGLYDLACAYLNDSDIKNESKAAELLQRAADRDYAPALYQLACLYAEGGGVAQNEGRALQLFLLAADRGHSEAQYKLGCMYRDGQGAPQVLSRAIELFQMAADQKHMLALYNLACLYQEGKVGKGEEGKAAELFQESANQGYPPAFYSLACIHLKAGNQKMAADLFQEAASAGIASAQFELGKLYSQGIEGKIYPIKAAAYFEQAAGKNHAGARFQLGLAYLSGKGLKKDEAKGIEHLEQAALQGDRLLQCELATMFQAGSTIKKNEERAIIYYTLSAKQGYPIAQLALGSILEKGQGILADERQAAHYYLLAAKQGNVLAMFNLGLLYHNGRGKIQKNRGNALEWYEKATALGNRDAQFNLAVLLYDRKPKKAGEHFQILANLGNVTAQNNLGIMYRDGVGVRKDPVKAAELFGLSAEQKNASAQCNLGLLYLEGKGVTRDEKKGLELLQLSVNQSHTFAIFKMGCLYRDGQHVAKNLQKAMQLFQLAADKGHRSAKTQLAVLYENGGAGIAKDLKKAEELYLSAAEEGCATAQFNLALMYDNGRDLIIAKNEKKAFKYYQQAARQNHASALNNLGVMYLNGQAGLTKSPSKAKQLFKRALKAGAPHAQDNLNSLAKKK